MSNQSNNQGVMYFLLGALIVAVLGLGYMYFQKDSNDNVTILEKQPINEEDFSLEISDDSFKVKSNN